MKLHYQIENILETQKPWLVLINGLFASLQSWDQSVAELTKDFRVLRYDCRGQGESPRPQGPYTLEQHTEDLLELLNDLGIEKALLIGLSNGGRIALNFSSLYPHRVIAQVVADTYTQVDELLKAKLLSWKKANDIGGGELRFEVASPWIWGQTYLSRNKELYDFYRSRANLEKKEVINSLIDGALSSEINVEKIEAPTLVLAGNEDLLTPINSHIEFTCQLPKGKFQIIPGGHASLLEYPLTIKETIIPYIKDYI